MNTTIVSPRDDAMANTPNWTCEVACTSHALCSASREKEKVHNMGWICNPRKPNASHTLQLDGVLNVTHFQPPFHCRKDFKTAWGKLMSGAQGSMKSSDTSRSNKTFLFSLLHERLLGHPTPRILLLNTGHKPTGNPLKMDGRKSPHCVSKHYWLASTCSRVFYRDYESLR